MRMIYSSSNILLNTITDYQYQTLIPSRQAYVNKFYQKLNSEDSVFTINNTLTINTVLNQISNAINIAGVR